MTLSRRIKVLPAIQASPKKSWIWQETIVKYLGLYFYEICCLLYWKIQNYLNDASNEKGHHKKKTFIRLLLKLKFGVKNNSACLFSFYITQSFSSLNQLLSHFVSFTFLGTEKVLQAKSLFVYYTISMPQQFKTNVWLQCRQISSSSSKFVHLSLKSQFYNVLFKWETLVIANKISREQSPDIRTFQKSMKVPTTLSNN